MGSPLHWLYSCLTNSTQNFNVNNSFSNVLAISAGVPQGSPIASILFILFISDAFQFRPYNIEIYL